MAIESRMKRRVAASQFVVDTWMSIADGRMDRLVLDPSQLEPNDWGPLLWIANEYHLPVELMLTDPYGWTATDRLPATVTPHGVDNCVSWGLHWWEVRHLDATLPISPRVSWVLRALSTDAPSTPLTLSDVNRQLHAWGQSSITESNFRGTVRAVRERIGPAHIVTVSRRGYLWRSCTAHPPSER